MNNVVTSYFSPDSKLFLATKYRIFKYKFILEEKILLYSKIAYCPAVKSAPSVERNEDLATRFAKLQFCKSFADVGM